MIGRLGHFLNHALGIISLGAMDGGIKYTVEPWRTLPGTIIILSALLVHVLLAFWALYSKRTLRMSFGDVAQICLGILIPILISGHVLATRGSYEAFGFEGGYSYQLYTQWVRNPINGFLNVLTLLIVWVHACLGWHFWLRLRPWYQELKAYAFALALMVPLLAITGIISGGFKVLRLAESEKWVAGILRRISKNADALKSLISENESLIQYTIIGLLAAIACIHLVRWLISSLPGGEKLQYRDFSFTSKREVKLKQNTSVLDLLRQSNIPHASVCGGRGRCSTCRVISVTALLAPEATAKDGFAAPQSHAGEEQNVAILFGDIRAFTKLSEAQLPYDTAFLLNRFFAAMGKAIEESGGHLDKFIGDGVMAIFGIDKPLDIGAREAIAAAKAMSLQLEQLNETLAQDIAEPLSIGIGIHCGRAIVGEMGYNKAVSLTAIGDVVNTASRLESMTKEFSAQLVVSKRVSKVSGIDFSEFPSHKVQIRGRVHDLEVHVIKNASVISLS